MKHTTNLTNSQLTDLIDDRIHSERDRRIMRLRLVDGLTYERIAEAVEMSPRYLRALVSKLTDSLKITE